MKNLIVILAVLMFGYSNNNFNDFLKENYKGGDREFLITIYNSVNYPKIARENCGIGKLKTRMHLNKDGTIERIEFLNELGFGLEAETRRVLKLTEGHWLESESERVFDFIVAFQIGDRQEIKGDINVTANMNGMGAYCKTNKELLEEFQKKLKKEKYKKANKICDELLKREPDSEYYNNLSTTIKAKLKMNK